jgi:hypothetical protein
VFTLTLIGAIICGQLSAGEVVCDVGSSGVPAPLVCKLSCPPKRGCVGIATERPAGQMQQSMELLALAAVLDDSVFAATHLGASTPAA